MKITNWNIEEMCWYKPITTFYTDFSIADNFGISAIEDTYKRTFKEWKSDYKYLTELVMVLNWKIWEHYESNKELASIYQKMFEELGDYAYKNLKGEELDYFISTTD